MASRHYLFPDEGEPVRISLELLNGLISGRDALPQYAGTRQRVLGVILELEDGKPSRVAHTETGIWIFDEDGRISSGLHRAVALAMDSMPRPSRHSATVVELHPRASERMFEKEFRWQAEKSDIDRVLADIWPKQRTDRLSTIKGVSKRKPSLSFEARHALNEISEGFWKIPLAIQGLKEPSQKAFGYEARVRSESDPDFAPLYRAIADMSDWQLDVQKRQRTGKGVWYAVVEVMVWHDGVGQAVERHHQRCNSRKEAVLAARKLLAEHAVKFDDNKTVEALLLTEPEWEKQASDVIGSG
ncbi:hypothetical protein HNQ96_001440 [Aminobacter lissarensis]|uniref:Uncharacterized protein n=1 Tax=Aminobacter carboxidus TaxID=376165 RepID=A0A8E1WDS5_9HYPH|nr:hypothetical protein [Aminobacter lissarensis]MBB6465582.1 hypothetical protein [Aminobacter lissarensis]